jgi:hypothetical protein
MLCIAILWIFFEHLLLLSLIRINFVVLCQDVIFDIRSVPFFDRLLLKAWRNVLFKLVGWDASRASSTLYLQLLLFRISAYLLLLRHILALLRHLFTLFRHSSVIIFFLLLWLRAHLWQLRIIPGWACRVISYLLRGPRLVVLVEIPITEDFLVILIVFILIIKLILVPGGPLLLFLPSIVSVPVHFAKVVNGITSLVSRVLLINLVAWLDEVVLLLEVTSWLRPLLVLSRWGRNYIPRLWTGALLALDILCCTFLVWIIFIVRLARIVSIVVISVLNNLIGCAWVLRYLSCVPVSRINRVGFSSSSYVLHLRLAWLWLSSTA